MKQTSALAFTVKDIKEALALANKDLPVAAKFPNGLEIRPLKEGAVTHLYLWDPTKKQALGVASVMRDKLPLTPSVKGVRIFQYGLLKQYRGLGFMWRLIDMLSKKHVVFAGDAMSSRGKKMWIKRIVYDKKHVYLVYKPKGFYSDAQDRLLPFTVLRKNNIRQRQHLAWDGSLKTRLIMVTPYSPVIKRYGIDIKND